MLENRGMNNSNNANNAHNAFEHNGTQIPRNHFYAIACNPDRSVAVEACAGAGKTWMLVSRIVRALLQGTKPHEILAITFTKKAAGEMRQRLQEWLVYFSQADDSQLRNELLARGWSHEPTPQDVEQLRNLHHELLKADRGVQIRTFHGWFAALVRSSPMQTLQNLGLPAQYELLQDDSEAVEQVWSRFYQTIATNKTHSDALADYHALVADYGRHQAQQALKEALNKRVEFDLADQHGIVENSVAFADVPVLAPEPLWAAASVLGKASAKTFAAKGMELEKALTNHDVPAQINALLTDGKPRKFSDKIIGIEIVRIAQDAAVEYEAQKLQHQAWLHQGRMARLARILIAQYAELKRESHWLDMNDLERTALTLLSDEILSGWVQERLDAQIRHLLIDEFQDTNPLQWQALYAWLTGYTGAGKAISVFFVGDPKQSIYRFRRAEPQVFKAAQTFVQDGLMGDLLNCDHTRRNAPAIMDRVNQVMLEAQNEKTFEGFRSHSTESKEDGTIWHLPRINRTARIKAAEEKAEISIEDWRDSLTEARHTEEESNKAKECKEAARWLAQYLQTGVINNEPVKAGNVMVLSRKRERLNLMQIELNALGIPAQQPEKNELADMPEVQDIIALLDVLVSPQHNLSLAQVLKSPIFGFDDDDLVQIALKAKPSEPTLPPLWWWDVVASDARLEALARWQTLVNSLPPHDALAAIYTEGAILEKYASAALPAQRESVLANLRALLAATLEVDQGRYITAYSLIRKLKKGGIKAPVRANAAAVQLLTVHGAKGLEAKLVLMLDTDAEAKNAPSMGILVDWPGESPHPQRFVFLASEARVPACTAPLLEKEKAERQREELNALYVALTRCRNVLVFSSLQAHRGQKPSWWERLLPHAEKEVKAEDKAISPAIPEIPKTPKTPEIPETFEFLCLQNTPATPVEYADEAIDLIAEEEKEEENKEDDLDSRMGQAMHRLLERYIPAKGFSPAERIAKEFDLSPEQMAIATTWAQEIVNGEGAWAWDSTQIQWQGNEVALNERGRLLRIDRLVQDIKGQWWILDYKSAHQPELDSALRDQLLRYCAAVSKVYPDDRVRTAFLTAQGKLIEIH